MKTQLNLAGALLLLSALNAQLSTAAAQGTAFTYQGRLNDGANPASGIYDLRCAIYDAATAGTQQGSLLTNAAASVSNGLFTVTLDFGSQFPGANRWLEIAVRTNGAGAFTTLTPRQKLLATPYAITAGNLSGTLPAAQLTGTLPSSQVGGTYSGAVTFNNAANNFTGNGTGLNNVNAATFGGLGSSNFWKTAGNAGTLPGANFIGTTDNQPLEIKVNGRRALRLEPTPDGPYLTNRVNVIAGSPANFVSSGAYAATIAGGGAESDGYFPYQNSVTAEFGTVGGGLMNTSDYGATVGGGFNNLGGGIYSAIGGGSGNWNYGAKATIGGGDGNLIFGNADGATISGGSGNQILDNGDYATIPGGLDNSATNLALAAGYRAQAIHRGALVWADFTPGATFTSTGTNQFLIRASGGVGIGLTNPAAQLEVSSGGGDSFPQARINQRNFNDYARLRFTVGGEVSKRWDLACRSNAFVIYSGQTGTEALKLENNNAYLNGALVLTSDRHAKENFRPVDSRGVLEKVAALPMQEWNYRTDTERTRHLGPMAQDFYAAFGLGTDDKHIATVDADGVALTAIQGLNHKLEAEVKFRDARIAELEQRLAAIESLLKR